MDLGGFVYGLTGAGAARNSARNLARANADNLAYQKQLHDEDIQRNEPWRRIGKSSLEEANRISMDWTPPEQFQDTTKMPGQFQDSTVSPGQYQDKGFNFNFQADPGYQFRQQQQQQAIERSAAAGGGLFSGATLSDLAQKSSQMASDEYGNAYNRARSGYENDRNFGYSANQDAQALARGDRNFNYGVYGDTVNRANQNRNFNYGVFSDAQSAKRQSMNDRFDRLSTLAGFGSNANTANQNSNTAFGNSVSNSIIGGANAQASGAVGASNANRQTFFDLANLGVKAYGAS